MKVTPRLMFGLRWSRMIEWARDVYAEKPGANELFHMGLMSVRAMLTPVSKKEYFHRMLKCHHCDVFNKARKSCRNGALGCGCYTPYKAIAPVDCWLYEQDKSKGWGAPEKKKDEKFITLFLHYITNHPIL